MLTKLCQAAEDALRYSVLNNRPTKEILKRRETLVLIQDEHIKAILPCEFHKEIELCKEYTVRISPEFVTSN